MMLRLASQRVSKPSQSSSLGHPVPDEPSPVYCLLYAAPELLPPPLLLSSPECLEGDEGRLDWPLAVELESLKLAGTTEGSNEAGILCSDVWLS